MATIPPLHQKTSIPPLPSSDFIDRQPPTIRLYPLSNYTFDVKDKQPEEDPSVDLRLKRLEDYYGKHGMRRTCEAILVCQEHNHPHILMLQIANAFFKLPGDYLPHNVDEVEGLKTRLNERLAPTGHLSQTSDSDWNVADTLAQWWRPNFETSMYPYLPPHVTRPKESKKLYLIQLPEARVLSVPKNMKLLAVPLFELYENSARYGPQLSAIPHYLSRFRWEFVDEEGEVVAYTPGAPVDERVKTKVLAGGNPAEGGDHATHDGANGAVAKPGAEVKMEEEKKASGDVKMEEEEK